VCLAEAGLRVRIVTDALPEKTTSAAAGAMWGPYLVEPRDRIEDWSRRTLDELRALSGDLKTGVRMVAGIEASRQPAQEPWWAHLVPDLRRCDPAELPGPFVDGFRFTAPLVDMPKYLGYLMDRLRTAGGEVDLRRIRTMTEAAEEASVVVNCAGVGARLLVPDEGVWPIRGQLVVVENPGIDEFFSEDTGLSSELRHIYPHGDTVVLRSAHVLGHRVGLRPTRVSVRVEEVSAKRRVLHNYGHGGAGVTLSWGCAKDIASRIG